MLRYRGHFIAPDLYHSLGNDSRSNTLRIVDGDEENKPFNDDQFDLLNSFYKITQAGFLSTIIINCSIMTFGFLTFGGNAMGVILNKPSQFRCSSLGLLKDIPFDPALEETFVH